TGITSGVTDVVAAAKAVASSAINAARGIFKERSPSRAMMQVGEYATEGMAIGLENNTDMVEGATAGVVKAAIPDPSLISGGLGGPGGGAKGFDGALALIQYGRDHGSTLESADAQQAARS